MSPLVFLPAANAASGDSLAYEECAYRGAISEAAVLAEDALRHPFAANDSRCSPGRLSRERSRRSSKANHGAQPP
jgi:hypothetical protein